MLRNKSKQSGESIILNINDDQSTYTTTIPVVTPITCVVIYHGICVHVTRQANLVVNVNVQN